jgi:hypothetical protein
MSKLDPLEVLEETLLIPTSLRLGPGQLVMRLGQDRREALSRLTSDMLGKARVPSWIFGRPS